MAPVIDALKGRPNINLVIMATAQHREMLDAMLAVFEIRPDIDLNIMQSGQTLSELTARLPLPLENVLIKERPDIVLVQGDTTTAFMVSLACFYQKIPVGHVEAGLRTSNRYYPFPEEMNRLMITRLSSLHFAPTEIARENLLAEGILPEFIFKTGNTVIDALHYILKKPINIAPHIDPEKKLILVTVHRRENFGKPIRKICEAICKIATTFPDVQILIPVHPNPNVYAVVHEKLSGFHNILLTEPLHYELFIHLLQQSYLVISDSGGVQEEGPTLGKPVLVLRENTERPEAVSLGAAKLVGCDVETIFQETALLLEDVSVYQTMQLKHSPYGDGKAGERIATVTTQFLLSENPFSVLASE
ncbi:MAG: UDP-N-acetylglucosamine 2-epimerase (non-hydrolyzing) [Chlamydiales bacterium]